MQNPSPQKWYSNLPQVVGGFVAEELRRGTIFKTFLLSLRERRLRFAEMATMDSLLRRCARDRPDQTFIIHDNRHISFLEIDTRTGQVAAYFKKLGMAPGNGVAIMLDNHPDFISVYMATQKLGLYAVPVNTALVGDGLRHILHDSRVKAVVIGSKFLTALRECGAQSSIRHVVVQGEDYIKCAHKKGWLSLEDAWKEKHPVLEGGPPDPESVSTILYTSGTTGAPKGVVYKYGSDWLRKAGILQRLIHRKDDVLYTCLPLFHANALFLTLSASLWLGLPVVLSRRFSASRFWDEIRMHKVTVFNAIGAMIPILLKNPVSQKDRDNSVRLVLSAACPAQCWREFEKRFGVTIWEGYSAVDGGQNFVFNFGNAPVGSFGRMSFSRYSVLDEAGNEAPAYQAGELVFKSNGSSRSVEYFHDVKSSRKKNHNGYVRTGDLVYRDDKGYLYFVGRRTESMRRRGENVSAYEVEKIALEHPDVLECAVYGVPSELGEQDIMIAVVPVAGKKISAKKLLEWMQKRLARHAVPRYVRILEALPKTPTHRVIKNILVEAGITSDAFDAEKKVLRGRS